MKRGGVVAFAVVLAMVVVSACYATTIVWTNVLPGPVYAYAADSKGNKLPGVAQFGATPDLSKGALVQLYKAVGTIDDPHMVMDAYTNPDWKAVTDADVLLQEIAIGYTGFFAPNSGLFSARVDAPVVKDDVVYARVFNFPKSGADAWVTKNLPDREIGIRNADGNIVSFTIGDPMAIHTFYFQNLRTEPIPEPASLLFLVPGLAIWALRRKK